MDARQIVEQHATSLDITQLMKMLPHRYPMLMVDRLEEIVLDHSAVGIKNVSVNEPFFAGHFPKHPVMPGVLIIEAMAQTAAVLVVYTIGDSAAGKVVYFMTVDDCRFRRPVMPGDQLRIHVKKQRQRGAVWKFRGEAKVDGVLVAEATFGAMILENK